MRVRVLGACFAAALSLVAVALTGCVIDEIVVATLEAGPPEGCSSYPGCCDKNSDCSHPNEFCDKPHCGEMQHGRCTVRPSLCGTERMPTCGCDGVSYWNDCVRRQSGISSSTPHECEVNVATCSTPADCPIGGASCARLLPPGATCSGDALGICWMLPVACPDVPSPETWTSCTDPMTCDDTCPAIRGGAVYQRGPQHMCPDRDGSAQGQ